MRHRIHKALAGVRKHRLSIAAFAFVFAVICVELSVLSSNPLARLHAYADDIVVECADAPYKPTCYDEEIPRLMKKISMEDAFRVTRMVQDKDTGYGYCHVLGHKLAAAETAKDPASWQTVIQRCPSGTCSNGCIHGAFQERFRKESLNDAEIKALKPQLSTVCEPRKGFSPTGLEQGSCYHALGHLLMYITSADIPKSLALCGEFANRGSRDFTHVCLDGVFMQIYQPLEPDDFSLIAGKEVDRSQVDEFCSKFKGEENGSCWSESWPLFINEIKPKPSELLKFCARANDKAEQERCFESSMYVLAAQFRFDDAKIESYCKGMPDNRHKALCMTQSATRMIETDYRNGAKAVATCERAAPFDADNMCFKDLLKFSTYNFHKGSAEWAAYCEVMPSPWKESCFDR